VVSSLSEAQIERYSRQIILPQIGGKGQEVLLRSKVLVNGNGLLRDVALLYLAAAGVGTIGILSAPHSSLFAALLPTQQEPVSATLADLNPDCYVVWHHDTATCPAEQVVQRYDIVLSGPDESLHAACYALQRPFLCAAVTHTGGWLFAALGYQADFPCLQCVTLHEAMGGADFRARDLRHAPILSSVRSPLVMYLGTIQATEAVKLLLGADLSSARKVWQCHFSPLGFSERVVEKNPQCPMCGPPSAR